jgi:hypothetical protein
MLGNYKKISKEYEDFTQKVNQIFFSDGEKTIQEFVFNNALEYCKDRPKFYTETEIFWNWYIRMFYNKLEYILFGTLENDVKKNFEKAKFFMQSFNDVKQLPDYIRGEIFIEHNQNIDAKSKRKRTTKKSY